MIKASKLKLAMKAMPFLGVLITENGIQPNPEKTKAIRELTAPKFLKQLSFIILLAHHLLCLQSPSLQ